MNRLLIASLMFPTVLVATAVSANPGTPDPAFGSNGLFRLPPRAGFVDIAEYITSAPGGKIILTGSTNNGLPVGGGNFREGDSVAVLSAGGLLDTGFATQGYRRSEFSQIANTGGQYAFALDSGQIIQVHRRNLVCGVGSAPACGDSPNGSPFIGITRFNANGAEDPTYGIAGSATLPGVANAIFASSQGELTLFYTQENLHRVIKITTSGMLLSDTFTQTATDTMTRCNSLTAPTRLTGVARLSDGRFVAAMNRTESGTQLLCLLRLGMDGSHDTTFGQTGVQMVTMGQSFLYADVRFLFQRPDGGLLAIHKMNSVVPTVPGCEEMLWFSSNGQPEARPARNPSRVCLISAAVFQPDGKLVVAGEMGGLGVSVPRMSRLNVDGTLDTSFGTSGIATPQFGDVYIMARHLHVDATGRILLTGNADSTNPASNTGGRLAVARFLSAAPVVPPTPIDPGGIGGGGGGCGTIHRGPFDPTLPALLLLTIVAMAHSRARQRRQACAVSTATSV